MIEVTVKLLAAEIQISAEHLIQKFADVGIHKSENDFVTQQEKETLLTHLNDSNSKSLCKLTLQRKTRCILSIQGHGGKSKSVQVEVRKKRTYIKENPEVQKVKNKVEGKAQNKAEETVKVEIEKKNKVARNQQIDNVTRPIQYKETQYEDESKKLKHKVEDSNRKLEENARHIMREEIRKSIKQKVSSWEEKSDFLADDMVDYHVTAFRHARQTQDKHDREVEGGRSRLRTTKLSRQRKGNKHVEAKTDREEVRAIIRSSKNKKYREGSVLQQSFTKPVQAINRDVIIGETITIAELANKMAVKGSQVIKLMMKMGAIASINQVIDQETAQLVAEKMGHKVILRHENELEEAIMQDRDIGIATELRAPVVTIMGHVDHGKTSLLDYIRSTKIASSEAGGITQHIGAYHVKTDNGTITFLDTPGHSAFTAMRARGAQVTDIVVLVVSVDDGVMPQTLEAIQHAKAADVPVVVAINKIDKIGTDPDRVKKELTQYGIVPEEWGGENMFVSVSAKVGTGIDNLLNAILLQAEILELSAVRVGMANGVVIESFLDKGRGPVATVLVREGTLHKGDVVLCGLEYGRVRSMRDELGHEIIEAGPSIPVEILGLSGLPVVGDKATVIRDEKKAREVALYRQGKFREVKLARQQQSNLENMFDNIKKKGDILSELNIVLKADVHGSVEAIVDALLRLSTDEVKVQIISSGVGGITETDAMLASASNAIILGFNVRADASARRIIEAEDLDLRYYSVIYNLLDEVKTAMSGMLSPKYKQKIIGLAKVRDVFRSPKFGAIAGCMVIEGVMKRHSQIRVLRKNIVIYEGELESLRRFKDDVDEVHNGMECGIGVKNYNDVRTEDIIEVFEITKIHRTLE